MIRIWLIIVFLGLSQGYLWSNQIDASNGDGVLPDSIWVYKGGVDTSLEEVLAMSADSGQLYGRNDLSFSFFNSVVWCRFKVSNNANSPLSKILQINSADVHTISLYELKDGKLVYKQEDGKAFSFNKKKFKSGNPVFEVHCDPYEEKEYVLKVFKLGGSVVLPLELLDYEEFYNSDRVRSDKTVFMYGLHFFAVLFNLFLLFILRRSLYLKYTLYVLFSIFSISGLTGYSHHYLWPEFSWLAERETVVFNYFGLAFLLLFVQDYLDLKRLLPRANKLMSFIAYFLLAGSIMTLFNHSWVSVAIVVSNLTTLLSFIVVISVCFIAIKHLKVQAVYVLVSYVPLLLGVFVFFLRSAGIINSTIVVAGLDFGITFQVLCLAFALVDSFRRSESEKMRIIEVANEKLSKLSLATRETDNAIAIYGGDGNLQWCNKGFENLRGLSQEEIKHNYGESILTISFNPNIGEYLKQCKESRESVVFETEYSDDDGNLRWLQTTLTPVVGAEKNVTNFITVGSDLTAIKQKEAEKQLLQEQLLQSQKMETVGKLAGGIAHDFNNILTPIIGYTEIVASELPPESQSNQDLKVVLNASHRARKLVRQILTFSRNFKEDARALKISDAVSEVFELMNSTMPANIKLMFDDQAVNDLVYADPVQIQQILMNLCANSFHAIDKEQGELRVFIENVDIPVENKPLKLVSLSAGNYVHIVVSDNGNGMDKETLSRLFDPFFTTKEVGKGTGLGLSVVHGIVIKYHGEIYYESKPGEGTSAHVYLPVCLTEDVIVSDNPIEMQYKGKGELIMVVDDEENIAKLLSRMLKARGYRVKSFTNSRAALQEYKNTSAEIDLIITDQAMPDLTGLELSKEAVAFDNDVKIIVLTGYNDRIDSITMAEIGVDSVLLKPLSINALLKKVNSLLQTVEGSSN